MTRTWASKMTHVVLKNENHPEHGNTLYSGYYIKIQKIIFTPKDTFWYPFNAAFARMYWLDVVKFFIYGLRYLTEIGAVVLKMSAG